MDEQDKEAFREIKMLYAMFGPHFVLEDTEAIIQFPRQYRAAWLLNEFDGLADAYGEMYYGDTFRILDRIKRMPGEYDGREFIDYLNDAGWQINIIHEDAEDEDLPDEDQWDNGEEEE